MKSPPRILWTLYLALCFCAAGNMPVAEAQTRGVAVTTYHYDALRTGWNSRETLLSASSFPANFGVLSVAALDDQVDAQPLLVPGEQVAGGLHDVVYVATEGNTVYALDAASGAVLVQRNLGPPVPMPLGCTNNGPNVGINGTPVIDLRRQRLYVIAYVSGAAPQYQLHALNLQTLADAVPPITVTAAHKLTDGSTYTFNATVQRQRPALLEFNGTIYAGFGSFCDFAGDISRGWVLGWSARDLTPLPSNELTDTQATSPSNFFLSAVWMSGYGLSSNGRTVFFATGNSDCNLGVMPEVCPPQSTYDGVTNIQESAVSMQPSLTAIAGIFTPANVFAMDIDDLDLGGGGVLLLPPQAGGANLATAAGKDGRLFLLDQNNLGTALDVHQLANGCWCGESYYQGADGVGRVVTNVGPLQTWQVLLKTHPRLAVESTTSTIPAGVQDPGGFTVVSSNGVSAGTAIIWAVGRPTSSTGLTLYAFSATPVHRTLTLLFSGPAGAWPNLGGNANTVPVVANGKAYVAAYKSLTIFGANGTAAAPAEATAVAPLPSGSKRVTGLLTAVRGTQLTLSTRSGKTIVVDAAAAQANDHVGQLEIGQAYTVIAPANTPATLWRATSVALAKLSQAAWPPDE